MEKKREVVLGTFPRGKEKPVIARDDARCMCACLYVCTQDMYVGMDIWTNGEAAADSCAWLFRNTLSLSSGTLSRQTLWRQTDSTNFETTVLAG